MKLTCYIIDDEPLAIEVLESYIEASDLVDLKGKFTNPVKAFQAIQEQPVDFIFLDIQMPRITGIELIKSLKNPPMVIFTTAFREYASDGFELDAVDYLLKPIPLNRFLQALDKINRMVQKNALVSRLEDKSEYLFLQFEKVNHKVMLHEIIYIESQRDYSRIVTASKEMKVLQKISDLELKLKNKGFLRIHRSFIVNLSLLESWCSYEVGIRGIKIPIGRSYYKDFMKNVMS
ncbi:MAG: response regulator transcription factor [Cyclobacteriaceae bacterium]|nr:response regulator transcription factor [Cyclobacteriaceae bacterium]